MVTFRNQTKSVLRGCSAHIVRGRPRNCIANELITYNLAWVLPWYFKANVYLFSKRININCPRLSVSKLSCLSFSLHGFGKCEDIIVLFSSLLIYVSPHALLSDLISHTWIIDMELVLGGATHQSHVLQDPGPPPGPHLQAGPMPGSQAARPLEHTLCKQSQASTRQAFNCQTFNLFFLQKKKKQKNVNVKLRKIYLK